ncbi:MAG: hypothetical protein OXC11_15475 [Rhodospirillales bacterium]|nr:hypothetical protein [Rhodospirillales bacterium]
MAMESRFDYLNAAREVLYQFPGQIAAFHRHDEEPRAGSPASRERDRFPDLELLDSAYAQGRQLVFLASTDHLDGLVRSLSGPMLSCTPYTCARGVLEACSTAIWLMDDRITYKKRIERSLNLRLEGVRSQGKFRDKVERQSQGRRDEWLKQNPRQRAQERIDHFRACAKRAKVREKCKGGRFIAFGSGMPRISERIRMSLDAEVDYSILSSVAHANTAVLPQLSGSLQPTDEGLLLKPGLSPLMAIWLIRNVVQWQSRAAWGCFRLFGRPLDGVTELLETTYERLGIEPERRFWTTTPDSEMGPDLTNGDRRAAVNR